MEDIRYIDGSQIDGQIFLTVFELDDSRDFSLAEAVMVCERERTDVHKSFTRLLSKSTEISISNTLNSNIHIYNNLFDELIRCSNLYFNNFF